jgi:NRAMP (natural resistance-associated macrophage protein)-like metal ion transporter
VKKDPPIPPSVPRTRAPLRPKPQTGGRAGQPADKRNFFQRLNAPPGLPVPLTTIQRWIRIIGPGIITGAADDDPSGIGTYSQAGASFGTGQLWLALYMLPMLIAIQEMCARIGLVSGNGIAAVVRSRYPRAILLSVVGLVVVANTLNIGADLGAMASTIQLFIPGIPILVIVFVLAIGMLLLEVFVPYRRYATVLKVLAISLAAYIITGLIIGFHDLGVLKATFVPSIQLTPAFLSLVVAVLGTTISPYLFFWQASEEVEDLKEPRGVVAERSQKTIAKELRTLRIDTIVGMIGSEIATWFIIFTTGSVLFTHGVRHITTANQAASALEPLVQSFPYAGTIAKIIFATGIIGVGLLGVPVLAGSAAYAVAEAFQWPEGLGRTAVQARGFYGVITLATLIGMALNVFHINPIAALVYSAIINGIVAVPLLVIILMIANNRKIMGEFTNGRLSNGVSIITTVAMGAAAIALVISLL